MKCDAVQWPSGVGEFLFVGCSPGCLRAEFPRWGPGDEGSVGGPGKKSPRSWSSLRTLFKDFDCRNDQI